MFDYVVHFLIGGFLFLFIYYYSKNNKTKLAALIPAIPILGIYGLILNIQNKNKINIYLKSIIKFILLALLFYTSIFFIYKFINRIFISVITSLIIWLYLVYNIL
tara:strand:- start:754 stop:1068 length:315 start_codon:yes stop_codon:yes gene_type:complete